MTLCKYYILTFLFYSIAYLYYLKFSHGLGNKAIFLQLRRFIPCAILAVLPTAITKLPLSSPLLVIPTIVCLLWIFTYPTLYFITNHKVSSDFEFHFEAVFGLYFIGWISSLGVLFNQINILSMPTTIFITITEIVMILIPIAQIIYFLLYKACINENGMQMIQDTHYNEIIEYVKSMPWYLNTFCFIGTISSTTIIGYYNFNTLSKYISIDFMSILINLSIALFLTIYLWKKEKGVFIRTAIVEFYLDIKEYREKTSSISKSLINVIQV